MGVVPVKDWEVGLKIRCKTWQELFRALVKEVVWEVRLCLE